MELFKRYLRLLAGFIVIAFGIVNHLNAGLGCSPWDVLSTGISGITGLMVGTCSIVVGAVVIGCDVLYKEKVGLGTFLNMLLIGVIINIIVLTGILPTFESLPLRVVQLIVGIVLQAYGTFLYMTAELGAGPRDTFMVLIAQKFHQPISIARIEMECIVIIVGVILGGQFGVGTILIALTTGNCLQFFFSRSKYTALALNHRSIIDEINCLKLMLKKGKKEISINNK